jgi:uncharacterized protein YceH (UPF0502 family)
MSDREFDHDAEANEYHIAVKQHLYKRIRELETEVAELQAKYQRLLALYEAEMTAGMKGEGR